MFVFVCVNVSDCVFDCEYVSVCVYECMCVSVYVRADVNECTCVCV